jgi:hypothetical protein
VDHIDDSGGFSQSCSCGEEVVCKSLFEILVRRLGLQNFSMRMVGDGPGEGRLKGKAKELGEGSSGDGVITLSDSDSLGSNGGVQIREDAKLKMVAKDLLGERQDQQVLDKALSKLIQIFPDACPRAAAENLSSQLKKTSPGTALERIINRYIEHGAPEAGKVPQEEPKPCKINSGNTYFISRIILSWNIGKRLEVANQSIISIKSIPQVYECFLLY